MIDQKQVNDIANDLAKLDAQGAPDAGDETAPSPRRKGLVPVLEPGDATALRLLASWRFASPVALAAIAWPLRSSAGQEWRMRRFVDCGWLGRRRMRFATTRHAVWARAPAMRLALNPPPPTPLVIPRWSEHVARHGWMRSVVAAAYVKAGWQVDAAGVNGPALQALKGSSFVKAPFLARAFPTPEATYPFDLALGRRKSDGKALLHILVVDDQQAALDRILFALPYEAAPERSSRVAVRFFPVDDATIWSPSERRFVFESPRAVRMHDSLRAAGLADVPVGNEGPDVPHWLTQTALGATT